MGLETGELLPTQNCDITNEFLNTWRIEHFTEPVTDPAVPIATLFACVANRINYLNSKKGSQAGHTILPAEAFKMLIPAINTLGSKDPSKVEYDFIPVPKPDGTTIAPVLRRDRALPQEMIDHMLAGSKAPENTSDLESHINPGDFGFNKNKISGLGTHSILNGFLTNTVLQGICNDMQQARDTEKPLQDVYDPELLTSGFYNISQTMVEMGGLGALVHDFGKSSIMVWAANRSFLPEEYELMKNHPEQGFELFSGLCRDFNIQIDAQEKQIIREQILLHHALNPHNNWAKAYPSLNWSEKANSTLPVFLLNFIDQASAALANNLEQALDLQNTRTRENQHSSNMSLLISEWRSEIPSKEQLASLPIDSPERLFWNKYQASLNIFIAKYSDFLETSNQKDATSPLLVAQREFFDYIASFDAPYNNIDQLHESCFLPIVQNGLVDGMLTTPSFAPLMQMLGVNEFVDNAYLGK